ncbi:MAG: S8 family serine peptidase [Thermodesulfobacteria bacterium]|nr:S8 family serine peptidase [Thermodesulfobacteriota bacterium]
MLENIMRNIPFFSQSKRYIAFTLGGVLGLLLILSPLEVFAREDKRILAEQKALELVKEQVVKSKRASVGWRISQSLSRPELTGQDTGSTQLRVVVYFTKNVDQKLLDKLKGLGAAIETSRANRVQLNADKGVIENISTWPEVGFIGTPHTATAQSVVAESVDASGANLFHERGITGKGVKVGIIDLGFFGYSMLTGTELPEDVTKENFRHDLCGFSYCPSQTHGTAVAEVIHDMAPDAQLYLAAVSTTDEFLDAIEWMEEQGVDIVNCSLGYELCGPINGQGWCSKRAGEMRLRNILPVFAIGNSGLSHWAGENIDANGDGLVEVDEDYQSIYFSSGGYEEVSISANWDDWGDNPEEAHSDQDIDLLILSPIPGTDDYERIAMSIEPQEGRPGQMPIEATSFYTAPGRDYYIFIVNTDTTRTVKVHVFLQSYEMIIFDPNIPAESLLQPSDSPLAVAVGAADLTGHLFDYSSRGPSWDGRVKPDITGFAGLSTVVEPGFSGTSAAAPTVTGAAALLKQAFPDFGPDQLQATLELLAHDIYLPGQDNGSGTGLLDISRAAHSPASPTTGFWWNPARDGSGISIQRGQHSDFVALYSYTNDPTGSLPLWYSASGIMHTSITGPIDLLKWHGWPIGGPVSDFTPNTTGKLSIFYFDDRSGVLQVQEPSTNTIQRQQIERFLFAQPPTDATDQRNGWWWDSTLPGNGIFIDVQGNTLFAAWYHYDMSGNPRWWTFSGQTSSNDETLMADILEWHGGPCLFCPQKKPAPQSVGHVELTFNGPDAAVLNWITQDGLSGVYHLTRFPF